MIRYAWNLYSIFIGRQNYTVQNSDVLVVNLSSCIWDSDLITISFGEKLNRQCSESTPHRTLLQKAWGDSALSFKMFDNNQLKIPELWCLFPTLKRNQCVEKSNWEWNVMTRTEMIRMWRGDENSERVGCNHSERRNLSSLCAHRLSKKELKFFLDEKMLAINFPRTSPPDERVTIQLWKHRYPLLETCNHGIKWKF